MPEQPPTDPIHDPIDERVGDPIGHPIDGPIGEPTHGEPGAGGGSREVTPERILVLSLRLVYIPAVILLLAALGAFVYGAVVFVHSVGEVADHPFPVSHQIGQFLLDIDLFFIGATLLISAVGLYELFIGKVQLGKEGRVPAWLEIRDLNDLKSRVIAMIVLVLSVSFVELVVDMHGGTQVLDLGGGIAAVIVALTIFQRLGGRGS